MHIMKKLLRNIARMHDPSLTQLLTLLIAEKGQLEWLPKTFQKNGNYSCLELYYGFKILLNEKDFIPRIVVTI